jgi:hypothetical protein
MKKALAIFACVASVVGGPQASTRGQQESTPQNSGERHTQQSFSVFQQIAPVLRRETRIPLRLPSFLPDVDEKHPVYAILESKNSSHYSILLAVTEDCEGQNNCLYGSVQGSTLPFSVDEDEGASIPIELRGGIKGQFIESVCHAYCNQAYVRWSENGFYYSIGIKAEKKEILIEVANSAGGPGAKR